MSGENRDRSSDGNADRPSPVDLTGTPKAADGELTRMYERIASLTETNRQLKRKIFDLYTIFEISRDFNSVLDYQSLLDTFILTSLAQVGASKAAIFLPAEGDSERYVLTRRRGSGRFPDRRRYFRSGSRLLEYMGKLNRPLPTEELMGDMARKGERSILECFHPGLAVPILYQTRTRGIFLITDKIGDRPLCHR